MKRLIVILTLAIFALVLWYQFSTEKTSPTETTGQSVITTNSPAERIAQKRAQRATQSEETSTDSDSDEDLFEAKELSREQIEAYLLRTKRSPESLLNAFWETGDTNFLVEAVEKNPNNSIVQWAKLNTLSPEERGPWLEKLKTSSPDNALPHYLSALDNLKSGNVEKGLAEMDLASQKKYSAFEQERMQSREEMYLLAGFSPVEAREAGMSGIAIPNLSEMKALAQQLDELQKKYIAAGDSKSAHQLTLLGIEAGRKMDQPTALLINTLVGSAMETIALRNLGRDTFYEFLGKTAGQRLQELKDQKQKIKSLMPALVIYPGLPDTEKLIYWDRMKIYGELEAMRWLQRTYGDPK
ncbi:MAG: hypothetical protein ABIR24_06030 [Verrucomicrobiota bacterium]